MWLVATFLLLGITQTHAEHPALQAVLSQKGLQKVSHWMTDWIQTKLSTITLPEVTGSVDIILGSVYYSLHDMTIVRSDLPEPSVSFSEGTGLSLQVHGLSLAINGRWNTDFGMIHDGGWFEMAVYTINLNTLLEFQNTEEHLSVATTMCIVDVGGVQINFHGGASFLFQRFLKRFTGGITNMVQERICPEFERGIENIDKSLSASDAIKFDPYVYLNVSLTDSPVVYDNGFELNVKGEFYSTRSPSEPPFSPNYFKLPWLADYMLSVGVSEFCINSAAFAYLKSGVLNITITDGMPLEAACKKYIQLGGKRLVSLYSSFGTSTLHVGFTYRLLDQIPKASPIHLNTSELGFLIPQLPKLYPDMEMEVLLYASDTPLISINQSVINMDLSAAAKFIAIKTSNDLIPLFRLDMKFSFSAKVHIDQQMLKGVVEMKNLTLLLGSTEIGQFEIVPIKNLLKTVISSMVLPKLNGQLMKGFPLPSVKGFSLNKSVMTIENGFLFLATDLNMPTDNL